MENNEYWAVKPTEEIAEAIKSKFEEYRSHHEKSGYFSRIKRSYDMFYSVNENGSLALEKTEDGKLTSIKINHYKSLIKRLHSLITGNKLAFEARAINSDSESQLDSDLAKGLLEFYESEKHLGQTLSRAVETALVCLEAHVFSPWDSQKGQTIATDGKKKLYEGDQEFSVLTAQNVASLTTLPNSPWKILRVKKHKYQLAAQYPEFADEILKEDDPTVDLYELDPTSRNNRTNSEDNESVTVYYMFHEKNHAAEQGRQVLICGESVLEDGPLEYEEIPCYQLKAGSVIASQWADSPAVDLLSLQQAIDLLSSATLSNNLDNAKQNIYSSDPNLKIRRLSNSQNLITSAQPPVGINFTASSPENYKQLDSLISQQQILSGINEAAAGAGASSASGSSIAIQLSLAVQSVSTFQSNFATLAGDIGSCVIDNLKAFSRTERIAYISGIRRKSYARRFKAEDLYNVDRIIVTLGSAATQNMAGRFSLLESFMQYGIIKDPAILSNFLKTGEIESATEDNFQDSILIRDENQMMLEGKSPVVVMTDNHPAHILKHKELFSDLDVRDNPKLMALVLDHIQHHIQSNKTIDPDLAAILQIPPLPSMSAPPPTPEGLPQPSQPNMPNLPSGAPEEIQESFAKVTNNLEGKQ